MVNSVEEAGGAMKKGLEVGGALLNVFRWNIVRVGTAAHGRHGRTGR